MDSSNVVSQLKVTSTSRPTQAMNIDASSEQSTKSQAETEDKRLKRIRDEKWAPW